ncbi:hypothetical protein [Embleya scabrispora]|uniref:hypothetical protein n=1 Tax=Embleya scabrispora TaxID=159449 RepID=UPI001F396A07|nr:hypothetical protein [Embleya scabrispora]
MPVRPETAVPVLDRLVRDVRHGRFQRTLALLTAAGSLVTAGRSTSSTIAPASATA